MRILPVLAVLASWSAPAGAQVSAVQIRDGDVWLQQSGLWARLTRDGRDTEAVRSRDGSLVAYVHTESGSGDDAMNSVSLCVVADRACRILVTPVSTRQPETNLTDAGSPLFSYQASARGGGVRGSLFFLADAWVTSQAIHRVALTPGASPTFVTDAVGYRMVPNGPFAGALVVDRMPHGSCTETVFDPNTGKALRPTRPLDC